MSNKAFYQTFYQTEQLFRRADDILMFPPLGPEQPVVAEVVAEPASPPPPAPPIISDPVVPEPVQPATPVVSELAPTPSIPDVPVAPLTQAVAEIPILAEEPAQSPAPVQERSTRRPATPLLSQKVLILVDEDLLPSDLLFLEKVLKAVNLDIAGVDLLNIHGTKQIDFGEVLAGKYVHHFFTFGVPFTRLNLDILMDRYQPIRFDGITFLMADPLPVIEADVVLKKKLWEALKKIFLWR